MPDSWPEGLAWAGRKRFMGVRSRRERATSSSGEERLHQLVDDRLLLSLLKGRIGIEPGRLWRSHLDPAKHRGAGTLGDGHCHGLHPPAPSAGPKVTSGPLVPVTLTSVQWLRSVPYWKIWVVRLGGG